MTVQTPKHEALAISRGDHHATLGRKDITIVQIKPEDGSEAQTDFYYVRADVDTDTTVDVLLPENLAPPIIFSED